MLNMETYKTYTAQDERCRNKLILGFILGVLVGFGGFYAWNNNPLSNGDSSSEKENIETEGEETFNPSLLNAIEVPNQPTYNKVFISSLTIEASGWVAIYEDREGQPGSILGAQLFDKGIYDYGQVDLLREMIAGGTYYAIVHFDDGDRSFDHTKDLPAGQELGQFIMATFSTI